MEYKKTKFGERAIDLAPSPPFAGEGKDRGK